MLLALHVLEKEITYMY